MYDIVCRAHVYVSLFPQLVQKMLPLTGMIQMTASTMSVCMRAFHLFLLNIFCTHTHVTHTHVTHTHLHTYMYCNRLTRISIVCTHTHIYFSDDIRHFHRDTRRTNRSLGGRASCSALRGTADHVQQTPWTLSSWLHGPSTLMRSTSRHGHHMFRGMPAALAHDGSYLPRAFTCVSFESGTMETGACICCMPSAISCWRGSRLMSQSATSNTCCHCANCWIHRVLLLQQQRDTARVHSGTSAMRSSASCPRNYSQSSNVCSMTVRSRRIVPTTSPASYALSTRHCMVRHMYHSRAFRHARLHHPHVAQPKVTCINIYCRTDR
jgi:hypothetical protein